MAREAGQQARSKAERGGKARRGGSEGEVVAWPSRVNSFDLPCGTTEVLQWITCFRTR